MGTCYYEEGKAMEKTIEDYMHRNGIEHIEDDDDTSGSGDGSSGGSGDSSGGNGGGFV